MPIDDDGHPHIVTAEDPHFVYALEALRDFTQFEFILEDWPFEPEDAVAAAKLRWALRDAVEPSSRHSGRPGETGGSSCMEPSLSTAPSCSSS